MYIRPGHWMVYMGGIGRVYMGALDGRTWRALDGIHGSIALDGCT